MMRKDDRVVSKAALVASGRGACDPPEVPGIQIGDWQGCASRDGFSK